MEHRLIQCIKQYGEQEFDDEEFYRVWLGPFNGVCDISGHTDILSAAACKDLDGEDTLVIQVDTPNDDSTIWVGLNELPEAAAKMVVAEILDQARPEA